MKSKIQLFVIITLFLIKNFGDSILHNEVVNDDSKQSESNLDTTQSKINPQEAVSTSETLNQDSQNQVESETHVPGSTSTSNAQNQQQFDAPSQSDGKTQPSIVPGVVVNKAEMQSFEEWKEMKLKDAVKQTELNKKPSQTTQQTVTQKPVEIQNEKASLRRKNYASLDCGAKIIANNQESSNPSHILTESKDDYMLNSCSTKVWFVIELCEPIKITEFQIANYELFSNVPKQFKVYASERYIQSSNGNGWPLKYFLGTYEAANTRSLQSFLIKDSVEVKSGLNNQAELSQDVVIDKTKVIFYAKYIKFEMLSHYGNEHYCPLSVVRVFGSSLNDDEESENDLNEHVNIPNEISQQPEEIKKVNENKNKFFNPTSTFLSNIISVFLGENFNLPNLFSILYSNLKQKESRTDSGDKRDLILQMDFHKLLCFTNSPSYLNCCKCFQKDTNINKNAHKKSSLNYLYYSNSKLVPNYCGYYYLMMTSLQARSNNSLLSQYLTNMRFNDSNLLNTSNSSSKNFTQISINNINYYILNEWLDNQTLSLKNFNSKFNMVENSSSPELVKKDTNLTNHSEPEMLKNETVKNQNLEQIDPVLDSNSTDNLLEQSADTIELQTSTEMPSVVQQPIVIGNGKDALLARLNNRIKMLELNMSLSSQYLEKLSQHYRKQMDEMQKAFNVTTSALIETIRIADERDLKQNEKIIQIEKKIEKMQINYQDLSLFLDDIKFQTNVIIWTIIVMLNTVIAIEILRCLRSRFKANSNKKQEEIRRNHEYEIKTRNLIKKEFEQLFNENKIKLTEELERIKSEFLKSNQIRFENLSLESTNNNKVSTLIQSGSFSASNDCLLSQVNNANQTNESCVQTPSQIQQQTVAAAAVVSSTLAVVAAVSYAAASAQITNTLNQTNDET